ncbi:hypothetical protein K7B10_28845 [Streptomyces flavotricini]|uniref:Uncharacterized protein n=1 Tax=Streptomyces flavotricini TaxID=66888 RepID=A0ABS8ED95_9ACTN|nr:hypothetical protein [Streptomyces flavotricini]MCC0098709.1 hypothetical protein [Streptomyces flavotricini]
MQEGRLDRQTWSEALRLYEWVCTFVGVAPRGHHEWWLDVGAIMRLETRDPRGWESVDPFEGEEERLDDPLFPWLDTPATAADADRYRARADELPRSSVRSLLVLLAVAASGTDVSRTAGWEEHRPERERRADAILSRFPDGTRFYTNLGWQGENPDFYKQSSRSCDSFSQYEWDAGLIAVNDHEVAVFWNFQNV